MASLWILSKKIRGSIVSAGGNEIREALTPIFNRLTPPRPGGFFYMVDMTHQPTEVGRVPKIWSQVKVNK